MLCCSRMSLELTTEKMASVSGPFIKWNLRRTIKRETCLPESCLNPRAYSLRHGLNLAQHANLDSCYIVFMVPRIKMIVKLTYFSVEFETERDISPCFYRS